MSKADFERYDMKAEKKAYQAAMEQEKEDARWALERAIRISHEEFYGPESFDPYAHCDY